MYNASFARGPKHINKLQLSGTTPFSTLDTQACRADRPTELSGQELHEKD